MNWETFIQDQFSAEERRDQSPLSIIREWLSKFLEGLENDQVYEEAIKKIIHVLIRTSPLFQTSGDETNSEESA